MRAPVVKHSSFLQTSPSKSLTATPQFVLTGYRAFRKRQNDDCQKQIHELTEVERLYNSVEVA